MVIDGLKRAEHSDAFDAHTSFNPFRFATQQDRTETLGDPP